VKYKTCKKCGGDYAEIFFPSHGTGVTRYSRKWRRNICIGCRQEEKDERKRRNRPLAKARSTFYRHADRFIKGGLAESRQEFAERFGWDVHQMAHDIEHGYANSCPYCHEAFAEMGHGLSDITLDIVDPEKPPYYTTNVKWICATDNKEKQRTPPEHWGAKLAAWDMWRKQQQKLNTDPFVGLPFFEGRNIKDIGIKRQLIII